MCTSWHLHGPKSSFLELCKRIRESKPKKEYHQLQLNRQVSELLPGSVLDPQLAFVDT